MSKISILDCTLRDGGYVNSFKFGYSEIQRITYKLCESNVDIIECGFLRSGKESSDISIYSGVEFIELPEERGSRLFVAMIEYGAIPADDIAPRQPGFIDGIRLTFHNTEWEATKALAQNLMDKGYKVFIQPIGTTTYTDAELIALISEVNDLNPFAFYLVDTLGSMYKNDLLRMYYLIDHNLSGDIAIGFHSHNNLQLSFSNAMTLLELHTSRHIIIDSSVFGMGRGAGNLNTELIAHFINTNIDNRYNISPLLELIDDIIIKIYHRTQWGFSAPYYLAAVKGVHPSYAQYLMSKQSLPIPKIGGILDKLPMENRHLYNAKNIEQLYFDEMRDATDDVSVVEKLRDLINDRPVLLIAPGKTMKTHEADIHNFIVKHNPFVVTVNFAPDIINPDVVFVGNIKRYLQLADGNNLIVVSSNVKADTPNTLTVDYESLLIGDNRSDSSGTMALCLLMRVGVKKVFLAGYDGFANEGSYYADAMINYLEPETVQQLNIDMAMCLGELRGKIDFEFITPSLYVKR